MGRFEDNRAVAVELSRVAERCRQNGISDQSFRASLLTLAIGQFVHTSGGVMAARIFEAVPQQIRNGMFASFERPEAAQQGGQQQPQIQRQQGGQPQMQQPQMQQPQPPQPQPPQGTAPGQQAMLDRVQASQTALNESIRGRRTRRRLRR